MDAHGSDVVDKSYSKEVLEWLQKKGYPLEMRVAKLLNEAGSLLVEQSRYYPDAKTGELRESDVVASWGGGKNGSYRSVDFTAVIECKATNAPWCIFTEEVGHDNPEVYAGMSFLVKGISRPSLFYESLFRGAIASPLIAGAINVGHGITQKRTDGRDPAFDALRQVASAAYGVLNDPASMHNVLARDGNVGVVMPVIVTNSPLVECYVDSSGSVCARDVLRSEVAIRTEHSVRDCYVRIVNIADLENFCSDLQDTADAITNDSAVERE
jgi:hypothetical protein